MSMRACGQPRPHPAGATTEVLDPFRWGRRGRNASRRGDPGRVSPLLTAFGCPGIVLAVLGVLGLGMGEAAAQETPSPRGRPGAEEGVDSVELRIRETLRDLSQGPGIDSTLLAQDTLEIMEERGETPRRPEGPVGGAPSDSTASALLDLPGYTATTYEGTRAEFDAIRRRLFLHGDSTGKPGVSREGMVLTADSSIVYDEETGRVRAVGNPLYEPAQGDPVQSENLVLDLNSERGSAQGARTEYAQGQSRWIVDGDLPAVESELVFGHSTSFTSCELEEPHYHFEAGEIKIHQDRVLVARPVKLYFGDVPVMWLPFIAQGLGEDRSSGLLTPRFSVNDIVRTSRGFNRRVSNVGFYWATNEYMDALVALDWFSGNFTSVTGSVRYSWMRKFLDGQLNVRRFWRSGGGRELALNTNHRWEISERTRFSMSANFASSTDFVRDNSFDPREVTQTIRSEGGVNHRFDWGSLNLGADRQEFLSDDRVETTFPQFSLSLNPITLFRAPPNEEGFFNNITWNGNLSGSRRSFDRASQPLDSTFRASQVDQVTNRLNGSQSLTLGNLGLSQSFAFDRRTSQGLPEFVIGEGLGEEEPFPSPEEVDTRDVSNDRINWSAGIDYQQRMIGSTTLTPSVDFSGEAFRSDTLQAASGWVTAPTRINVGASLKTDVYGFLPGFGPFETVRHKISPTFTWRFTPEATPSELQRQVFGSRGARARNVLTVNLNQTFEARLKEDEEGPGPGDRTAEEGRVEEEEPGEGVGVGTPAGERRPGPAESGFDDQGLERLETGEKMTVLSVQTSAVSYDFVQADSAGEFLAGFTTTTLSNSIRSDFLRGLSLQLTHDLFDQKDLEPGETRAPGAGRSFSPHLSAANLSFSFSSSSALFRRLGFPGAGREGRDEDLEEDPFAPADGVDESSVVPGGFGAGRTDPDPPGGRGGGGDGAVGSWNANVSYALQRPRDSNRPTNQTLQLNLRFQPTEFWDVSWRTSYDVEGATFNDHLIRLTRDLHRWQANFDFLQTATGNWTFRFQVSLTDNRDLKFDYEQRSDVGTGGARRFRR